MSATLLGLQALLDHARLVAPTPPVSPTVVQTITRLVTAPVTTVVATPAGSGSVSSSPSGITAWVAVIAAVITAGVALWIGILGRRTGIDANTHAKTAADAATKAAEAAEDSAKSSRKSSKTAARRAEQDSLAKRYQDGADQLGSEKATVRLAGVYAMARLADDWPEQRQACINVLCAHLRMPWTGDPATPKGVGDAQVRRAILRVFNERLHKDRRDSSWSPNYFDLSGGRYVDLQLSNLVLNGAMNFSNASFEGACSLVDIRTSRSLTFESCHFYGTLAINKLSVPVGSVLLTYVTIHSGARVAIGVVNVGVGDFPRLQMSRMRIEGKLSLHMAPSEMEQGRLTMTGVEVVGAGQVTFSAQRQVGNQDTAKFKFLPVLYARKWRMDDADLVKIPPYLIDQGAMFWQPSRRKPAALAPVSPDPVADPEEEETEDP